MNLLRLARACGHTPDAAERVRSDAPETGWRTLEAYARLLCASEFVFSPRGHGWSNYRDWEALSCGAIPILIGDGWVLPFSEGGLIDYREIAICVRESDEEIRQLPSRLRQISARRRAPAGKLRLPPRRRTAGRWIPAGRSPAGR